MKSVAVLLLCAAVAQAQFGGRSSFFSNAFSKPQPFQRYRPITPSPAPIQPVPVAPQRYSSAESNANILRAGNDISPDGSYNYFYETDNGIAAQEQGTPRNFGGNPPVIPSVAQGSFSWTSPEGVPVVISYVADENGYQPSGNVLPTPPPIPPQIARALEYIARAAPRK